MGDWGDCKVDVAHVIPDDSTRNKRTSMDRDRDEGGFFSQRRRKGEKSRKSWGRKRKQKAGEKEPGEKGK